MKLCDHQSVGVIVTDADERLLLLNRAKPPAGKAPIAGHVDEHGTPRNAAEAEAFEEAGLALTSLVPAAEGQLPNVCRRPASHTKHDGHFWTIFEAMVDSPQVTFSADETHGGGWYTSRQVQELADQTIAAIKNGYGLIGLEPVWVHWLGELGYIRVNHEDLPWVWAYFSQAPSLA